METINESMVTEPTNSAENVITTNTPQNMNIKEYESITTTPLETTTTTTPLNTTTTTPLEDTTTTPLETTTTTTPLETPSSGLEFNRSKLEALGAQVRLTDTDEATGLELFCYVHCESTDDVFLHQCRGVVFNKQDIVMKAFPYTVEYDHTDTEQITTKIGDVFEQCVFYDAHEGALVRMFFFDGKWFTCTHRKLNAFRSKWASRESFGSSFKRALEHEMTHNTKLAESIPAGEEGLLERFQTTLNQNSQYMFLIRHCPENRIVCIPPENPTVYHVGTFVGGNLVMTENCNIPHSSQHTFPSLSDLIRHVGNIDIRYLQGIICFAPNNKQYKIMHKDYLDLFRARGNEPSIKFRYLQVRMNNLTTDMLYHLYPDMIPSFDEIENNIYEIAKNIYSSYVQRFIKKKFVTVPIEDFSVIRECHKWHEENRLVNRINIDKIITVINQQTPTNINRMIRRFRTEKKVVPTLTEQLPTQMNLS